MKNCFTSAKQNNFRTAIKLILAFFGFSLVCSAQAAIVFDKEHSPYYLNSTLTIAENDTLIILEGTTVIIDTAVDIVVNGTMLIIGTPDEPVQILPKTDTIGWGRIYLEKPGANCSFEYVNIVTEPLFRTTPILLTERFILPTARTCHCILILQGLKGQVLICKIVQSGVRAKEKAFW